jgi:hypothetical protein
MHHVHIDCARPLRLWVTPGNQSPQVLGAVRLFFYEQQAGCAIVPADVGAVRLR